MPTCQQSIQQKITANDLESIPLLTPNTQFPLSITMTNKQLYRLETSKQETVYFTIALSSSSGSVTSVGVTVSFFIMLDNTPPVLLGSAAITENILSFQKDLNPGSYIICIGSSRYTYTGTFMGAFTGFQVYAKIKNTFHSGGLMTLDLSVPLPPRGECKKLKYFEIKDGSLPPGLVMTPLGVIEGVLPNMDCIKENDSLSPSQNWYYELDDNTWQPWGRQWRFKVKVYLFEFPDVFEERWFCIRVHNNWSWDKDRFEMPVEHIVKTVQETPKYMQTELCCESTPDIESFSSSPIPKVCDCESEGLVEQVEILNFLSWYQSNINQVNPSPDIQKFLKEFQESDVYLSLKKKAGLEEKPDKSAVESLIEIYTQKLIDGRSSADVDYQMLQLKDQENQKLPITCLGFNGCTAMVRL